MRLPAALGALTLGLALTACSQPTQPPPVIINGTSATPTTSAASVTSAPATGDGEGTIAAVGRVPGGCNDIFTVSGAVTALPSGGRSVWVIKLLDKSPPTDPNDLHFPKVKLPQSTGPFSVPVPNSTGAGNKRSGSYLLVAADAAGDAELERSKKADEQNDKTTYPDGDRVKLPEGVSVISRSAAVQQNC